MLARRRNLMLVRRRGGMLRKARIGLASAVAGAGPLIKRKEMDYAKRKIYSHKKSSFQNVKVEGNGGQISRTTMGAKSSKSRGWLTAFKKIGNSQKLKIFGQ